jgi:hypothetical protein
MGKRTREEKEATATAKVLTEEKDKAKEKALKGKVRRLATPRPRTDEESVTGFRKETAIQRNVSSHTSAKFVWQNIRALSARRAQSGPKGQSD